MAAARPPRAAFIDYPLGHSVGIPFDPADQARVVAAGLTAFETIATPETMVAIPGAWPADPDWKAEAMRAESGDFRSARDTTPQYQHEDDRRLAEAAAAGD